MPSDRAVDQPALEFLTSEFFGIIQTGKKAIPGLKVFKYGNGTILGDFNSTPINSALFGQALKIPRPAIIYVDSDGDELAFTGTTNSLNSFTVGFFSHVSVSDGVQIGLVANHNFGNGDIRESPADFRMLFGIDGTASQIFLVYSDGVSETVISNLGNISAGWQHIAFTFDNKTSTFKTFYNGALTASRTIPSSICCSGGSYFFIHSLQFTNIFLNRTF